MQWSATRYRCRRTAPSRYPSAVVAVVEHLDLPRLTAAPTGATVSAPPRCALGTAQFLSVRTLPADDDLAAVPDEDLTWELVYEKVLRHYHAVTPRMSTILDLSDRDSVRTFAARILDVTDLDADAQPAAVRERPVHAGDPGPLREPQAAAAPVLRESAGRAVAGRTTGADHRRGCGRLIRGARIRHRLLLSKDGSQMRRQASGHDAAR